MRIYVKGFGCSSSLADAEVLAGVLRDAGHSIVRNRDSAELLIYNTCAVKAPTEDRAISLLKRVPKKKKLIVAGCLPLVNFERLRREVRFDGVVGPAFGEGIVEVVREVSLGQDVKRLENGSMNMPPLDLPRERVNPAISIIPISYGCLGSCSYCCVRFARGKLRSYDPREIRRKVERDMEEGVQEFWLTSQDTACYGKDIGTNLACLMKEIPDINGDFLVRIGMMTPNNLLSILDEVVEAFRSERFFKFLHLPVQSGNENVLRKMNRTYSVNDFTMIVNSFRTLFPRLTFATDVIVGFPGETKEAFGDTWELVKNIQPDIVNVSKFFSRPKVPAEGLGQRVLPSELKRRTRLLAGLVRRIALERNADWVGWDGTVFVDEMGNRDSFVGRNFAYKPVVIEDIDERSLLGQLVHVKIIEGFQSHLLGVVV